MEKFLEAVANQPEQTLEPDLTSFNENPSTTRSNKTNSTSRNSVLRRSKSFEGLHTNIYVYSLLQKLSFMIIFADSQNLASVPIRTKKNVFRLGSNQTRTARKNTSANHSEASTQRDQSLSNDVTSGSRRPVQKQNPVNIDKKVKEMMYPWVKTPFVVNSNVDNRVKSQDKLLRDQQNMIKGNLTSSDIYDLLALKS
jgi:hypothetical protein